MIKEKTLIIRLLNALFPDAKIYLFGSRARGTHRSTSDIDLAIDTGHELPFLEITRARNILEMLNIPEKIDVIDLWAVPSDLKQTILKEGILWKN